MKVLLLETGTGTETALCWETETEAVPVEIAAR